VNATPAIYGGARTSERFGDEDEALERRLQDLCDAHLPRDPMYPDRQLVRSSYLAPVDETLERTTFARVREYLGAAEPGGRSGPVASFLELKHVHGDGTKAKERVAAAAGLLDQLRAAPTGATVRASIGGGDGVAIADRAAQLLDSAPHFLEPATDYGRLAWQDAAGGLRITLDHVAPSGIPLSAGTIERRVLEVKHLAGASELPGWLAAALGEGFAADGLVALRHGPIPGPIEQAALAAGRVVEAVR
jgi:hypothetical protein